MGITGIIKRLLTRGSKQVNIERALPFALGKLFIGRYRLTTKQKTYLFRQLAYLIDSGYSIELTLHKIKGKEGNEWYKAIIRMISVIQETGSLTSALAELDVFSPEILYQVKGGELSGELASVLLDISRTFETNSGIKRNLAVMMIYPSILIIILFAAIYIISTYVMPQIMMLVAEIEAPLSNLSKVVISVSGFIAVYGVYIIIITILMIVGLLLALRYKRVRRFFDALLLKIYMVKDIARMMDVIRFSNVFCSLFQSGVELETSLDCAARTVKNYVLKTAVLRSKRFIIKDGMDFAEALGTTGLFDETELQLIDIGAGVSLNRLCEVFKTMAARTSQVLESQIKATMLLIEPAIILVLGITAGLFIVGIYSPVYAIVNAM